MEHNGSYVRRQKNVTIIMHTSVGVGRSVEHLIGNDPCILFREILLICKSDLSPNVLIVLLLFLGGCKSSGICSKQAGKFHPAVYISNWTNKRSKGVSFNC